MNPLPLEFSEEAFCRRVIAAMADVAHAADDVVVFRERLVLGAGELRAAVGVQDDVAAMQQPAVSGRPWNRQDIRRRDANRARQAIGDS